MNIIMEWKHHMLQFGEENLRAEKGYFPWIIKHREFGG